MDSHSELAVAPRAPRTRRQRTTFSFPQLSAMEDVFYQTQYPDVKVLSELSRNLKIPVEKICTWFQNRRSKYRKMSKSGHISWTRQQVFKTSEGKRPPSKLKSVSGPPDVPQPQQFDYQSVTSEIDNNNYNYNYPVAPPSRVHPYNPPVLPNGSNQTPHSTANQQCPYVMTMHTFESPLASNGGQFQPQWYPAQNNTTTSHEYYTTANSYPSAWPQTTTVSTTLQTPHTNAAYTSNQTNAIL